MKTETRTRLLAVDNLRIVLTALVVVHHVAVTYGNIPAWYFHEPAKDPSGQVLDVLVMFNQAFFMGFFFLISGLFTPGSYDRKGGRPFMRDRLKRLGIPLLVFLLVLRPLVMFQFYDGSMPYWMFYLGSWDPGPMWFVEVLLVFAAVYALWRNSSRRAEPRGSEESQRGGSARTVRGSEEALGGNAGAVHEVRGGGLTLRAIVLFVAGLAVATFAWRFLVLVGQYWPIVGLPTPSYLPQYVSLFVVGLLAFRRGWFGTLPRAAAKYGFIAAGVASAVLLPVSWITQGWLSQAAQAAWESVFAVSLIIALSVWFRERFNSQGPRGKFLADHAYTVYFIHPVVLVGISAALSGLQTLAIVKFALVTAIALPLCWGLAYLVRSIPGAKKVL